jgi:hypothetical protein
MKGLKGAVLNIVMMVFAFVPPEGSSFLATHGLSDSICDLRMNGNAREGASHGLDGARPSDWGVDGEWLRVERLVGSRSSPLHLRCRCPIHERGG